MEKEFLHVTPEIVSYSRTGAEIGRFPVTNPHCLIGKSRDCDIIVSLPGVKDVHCQIELCQGEVLFTDENGVERFLQCSDKFYVKDREFSIEIPFEPKSTQRLKEPEIRDRVDSPLIKNNKRTGIDQGVTVNTIRKRLLETGDDFASSTVSMGAIIEQEVEDTNPLNKNSCVSKNTPQSQNATASQLTSQDTTVSPPQSQNGTATPPQLSQNEIDSQNVSQSQNDRTTEKIPILQNSSESDNHSPTPQGQLSSHIPPKSSVQGNSTSAKTQSSELNQHQNTSASDAAQSADNAGTKTNDFSGSADGQMREKMSIQGEDKPESEDELEDTDNDDSNADPDYNPASDDEEFDRESSPSGSSLEEQDLNDNCSGAGNSLEDVIVSESESEYDPIEPADSVVYPQLCSEKLLTTQPSGENSRGNLDNKKHACLFCEKLYPNIARHLTNKHSTEHEVAKILVLPKKSKLRRKAWEELVNKGDFLHNYNVIDKGYGMVIPKYRSKMGNENVKSLIPCQSCRGFYKKSDLWKHQQRCIGQKSTVLKSKPVQAGKLLMPHKHTTEKFHEKVTVIMKDDEIKRAVESDSVILRYGNSMFESSGHEVQNHTYISCKMRELGRLLIAAKNMDSDIKSVLDLMKGSKFWDLLIAAVKTVAEYDGERHLFGIPSLARKLGHSMKGIAEMEYFESLKNGNTENCKISQTFLEMYALKWTKAIGSIAYSSLEENKYNKPQLLPLVEDVSQLNKYLNMEARSLCDKIEHNPQEYYPALAKVCLAQVILFNRKRSGEAQRMTIEGYRAAKLGGLVDNAVLCSLTKFEQKLIKSHLRVEIKGKKGRRVPVLLTGEMVSCVNKVLKYREAAGISNQKFLFARPGSAKHPYRGCDVLREFANKYNLKQPDCITSTKLRKQLATLAQILNLKDNDQDLLATFQGHDIRVHRQFYRLPESTLQVAKISKLLHCLNDGTISKYKGCDFDDIELESEEVLEEEDESDSDCESDESESEEELLDDSEPPRKMLKKDDQLCHKVEVNKSCPSGIDSMNKSGTKKRTFLTDSERNAIKTGFRKEIWLRKVPGKLDVINFIKRNPSFNKYPWTKVKFAVHNMITARKRENRS